MTDMLPGLTAAALGAWLQSLGPDEHCGISHVGLECPLAAFLSTATGQAYLVTERGVCRRNDFPCDAPEPLPLWARQFVALVDEPPQHVVSAQEARALLAQALELTQYRTGDEP